MDDADGVDDGMDDIDDDELAEMFASMPPGAFEAMLRQDARRGGAAGKEAAALLVQAGTAGNGARHQNEHHDDDEKTAVSEVGVLVEDTAPVFGPMPIAR